MTTHGVEGIAVRVLLVGWLMAACPESPGQERPGSERDRGRNITPARAKQQVDEIVRDLREARAAVGRVGDRAVRERIEGLLSRAELHARDLAEERARARATPPQPLGPLPPPQFEKLLKGLKAESFDDGKVTYVENFASRVPLSCEQAATLLKCFSFDDGRIKALKAIYPNLVDPLNLNDVLAAYSFPSSRAAARQAVGLK